MKILASFFAIMAIATAAYAQPTGPGAQPDPWTYGPSLSIIYNNGGMMLGNPTGGTQGIGTINLSGGLYVNGVAVGFSTIPANTVFGNFTASAANPAGFAMPSCSTSASALKYTTSSGFSCNTAISAAAGSLSGATLAAGVTASSLTSVGTITAGVWSGTAILPAKGGTGVTTMAAHGVLLGEGTSPIAVVAPGTAGQVYTSNGAGADGSFQSPTFTGFEPQGRLTLQSGVPVMITTQAAQTTVYYAPFVGRYVPIYNGTAVTDYDFTSSAADAVGLSLVLGSNWAANTNYDLYVTLVAAAPKLCSVAWTNSTTRATAMARYTGLRTNGATATCRTDNATTVNMLQNQGTYLGSFYTNGSTGTVDWIYGTTTSGGGAASFGVWNAYNRLITSTTVADNGVSYTYGTVTVRQARASAGNQVTFISGLTDDSIGVSVQMSFNATSTVIPMFGYGLDTTAAFSGNSFRMNLSSGGFTDFQTTISSIIAPQLGRHVVSLNEEAGAAATTTFNVLGADTLTIWIPN